MFTAYKLVSDYYGDRVAKRSGVPLINHIDEGLGILEELLPGDKVTKRAFCVHPLIQGDDALAQNWEKVADSCYSDTVLLAIEYRNIANQSLSDIVEWSPVAFERAVLSRPIKVSPLKEVNCMLIADKVQNRADFEVYHKLTHPRSAELSFYFKSWLDALGVTEENYTRLALIGKAYAQED